jgi:hypothetical protein
MSRDRMTAVVVFVFLNIVWISIYLFVEMFKVN